MLPFKALFGRFGHNLWLGEIKLHLAHISGPMNLFGVCQ
jgi:hypothetical protein